MREPRHIGGIIRREQRRLWKSCPGLSLQSLWEQAAGADIAAQTSVRSLHDGVMTVVCSSGGWACELKLHADSLKSEINRLRPPENVSEIRFVPRGGGGWKSRK